MSLPRKILAAAALLLAPAGLVHAGRSGSFEPSTSVPRAPVSAPDEAPARAPAPLADGDEVLLPAADETAPETDAGEGADGSTASGAEVAKNPFTGPDGIAVRRRAPPLDGKLPFDASEDLIARMRPGADGRLQVKTADGVRTLTLDPVLQRQLTHVMASYRTPHAAAVVLEPSSGRVLAMAQHAEGAPEAKGLAVRAAYPAASVFKLVTASALVRAGLGPTTQECYDGGLRRVSRRELLRPGSSCVTLASAMGLSTNVVFAKLAHQHLTPAMLAAEAERFGFNTRIPFAQPVEPSPAVIPETKFAFAETGAGFGDVYLSPLHGALLAATVANGGVWVDPHVLEPVSAGPRADAVGDVAADGPLETRNLRVQDAASAGPRAGLGEEARGVEATASGAATAVASDGGATLALDAGAGVVAGAEATDLDAMAAALQAVNALVKAEGRGGEGEVLPEGARRIMDPEQAAALAEMLEMTVTQGTARRTFAERGFAIPDAVGKTGTLADNQPFRDYSWFVGYAPKDAPRVAVAVVIVNDPIWRIRATWLAREAMRLSLKRLDGEVGRVVSAAPMAVPALAPKPLP